MPSFTFRLWGRLTQSRSAISRPKSANEQSDNESGKPDVIADQPLTAFGPHRTIPKTPAAGRSSKILAADSWNQQDGTFSAIPSAEGNAPTPISDGVRRCSGWSENECISWDLSNRNEPGKPECLGGSVTYACALIVPSRSRRRGEKIHRLTKLKV